MKLSKDRNSHFANIDRFVELHVAAWRMTDAWRVSGSTVFCSHVHVVHAGFFPCRLSMTKVANNIENAFINFMGNLLVEKWRWSRHTGGYLYLVIVVIIMKYP